MVFIGVVAYGDYESCGRGVKGRVVVLQTLRHTLVVSLEGAHKTSLRDDTSDIFKMVDDTRAVCRKRLVVDL